MQSTADLLKGGPSLEARQQEEDYEAGVAAAAEQAEAAEEAPLERGMAAEAAAAGVSDDKLLCVPRPCFPFAWHRMPHTFSHTLSLVRARFYMRQLEEANASLSIVKQQLESAEKQKASDRARARTRARGGHSGVTRTRVVGRPPREIRDGT